MANVVLGVEFSTRDTDVVVAVRMTGKFCRPFGAAVAVLEVVGGHTVHGSQAVAGIEVDPQAQVRRDPVADERGGSPRKDGHTARPIVADPVGPETGPPMIVSVAPSIITPNRSSGSR